MAKNRGKRPVSRFDPPHDKVPRTAVAPTPERKPSSIVPTFNTDKPSWRISKLETVEPFGWESVDREKLDEVRGKLAQFESMTWNEILVGGKKQNHSVEVWQLCKEAQDRLAQIGLGDAEILVSLRLSGKERVWGLRQGAALLVLWWDPEHAICPSLLKNT